MTRIATLRRSWPLVAVLTLCAAVYLYDPPWTGRVTSGLRDWEEDPPGTRFRWTDGHASFFVPSRARTMTVPMRGVFPLNGGQPVIVSLSVDDRWLTNVELKTPTDWEYTTVPLPPAHRFRSFRRVELRVSRVLPPFNLGIEIGELRLQP